MPVATLAATTRPRVALPPAVTLVGVSVAVTPLGEPLTARATVSALPEMTAVLMPVPPEAPWAIERLAGLAAIEKSLGVVAESATVSKVAVESAPVLWLVTAIPARIELGMLMLRLEPGTAVQVTLSGLV